MSDAGLALLNSITPDEAETELLICCGSKEWARQVARARPFPEVDDLLKTSQDIWWGLKGEDWLEAFRSHPKIGERKTTAPVAAAAQKWSEQEQAGIDSSTQDVKSALAELNSQYEKKFGFIFIVCATGKSSEEMLALLRERLGNRLDEELRIAATEQAKITELRIKKLINS